MESQCGSAAICFVSFLPDILDSKAEGRNKYLTTLRNVAEKYKRSAYRQVIGQNLLSLHNYILLVFLLGIHQNLY